MYIFCCIFPLASFDVDRELIFFNKDLERDKKTFRVLKAGLDASGFYVFVPVHLGDSLNIEGVSHSNKFMLST